MFDVSRRMFLAGAAASSSRLLLGGSRSCATAVDAQERVPPHLTLGVLSDIHIFDEKQVPVF